jgi:hypothetical protein
MTYDSKSARAGPCALITFRVIALASVIHDTHSIMYLVVVVGNDFQNNVSVLGANSYFWIHTVFISSYRIIIKVMITPVHNVWEASRPEYEYDQNYIVRVI